MHGHSAVAQPHKLWKAQCAVSSWYLWWTRFPKLLKMCIQKQWIEREACGRNKRHEERGDETHTPNFSSIRAPDAMHAIATPRSTASTFVGDAGCSNATGSNIWARNHSDGMVCQVCREVRMVQGK